MESETESYTTVEKNIPGDLHDPVKHHKPHFDMLLQSIHWIIHKIANVQYGSEQEYTLK